MADKIESYQHTIGQQGAAERDQLPIDATGERSVMAEFADAAQSTAEALLQKQKQQIADRVSGMAEALECAAHSLDQSQNRIIGRYVQDAGQQIRSFSRTLQERRWNELIEDFARRQPTWFVLGAVAAGFLVSRLVWTATNATTSTDAARKPLCRDMTREVTAATSSAPGLGGGTGEMTNHIAGSFATAESR
jgi:hypothetical protein